MTVSRRLISSLQNLCPFCLSVHSCALCGGNVTYKTSLRKKGQTSLTMSWWFSRSALRLYTNLRYYRTPENLHRFAAMIYTTSCIGGIDSRDPKVDYWSMLSMNDPINVTNVTNPLSNNIHKRKSHKKLQQKSPL